jgi:phytoene dehydrogenase-like protein
MSASVDVADAVVIGSGPNGLVAAITLARKGWDVVVLERAPEPGGAVRSAEMTAPGYIHDPFSAFYGLLHLSPVFKELDLGARVRWAEFDTPVGAVVDPQQAAFIHRDLDLTAKGLDAITPGDGDAWRDLYRWWEKIGTRFFQTMLAPFPSIRPSLRFARAAGIRGAIEATRMFVAPLDGVARARFQSEVAATLFSCGDSHTDLGVDQTGSTPMALILAMIGQQVGFPIPVGGAGKLTDALVEILDEAGGRVHCGDAVTRIVVEHGRARAVETAAGRVVRARHAVIADTGPLALVRDLVGEDHFPARFLDGVRAFRYGTGVFKLDIALRAPLQWSVPTADTCGVVHVMGDLRNMSRAANETHRGLLPAHPLLIVGQQCVADPSRAPEGGATLWIETHVPSRPEGDASSTKRFKGWPDAKDLFLERVLERIEEHAPGAREKIVGMTARTPVDLEAENPNLVGGDIGGGSSAVDQQLLFRPVPGWFRYRMPVKSLYLCSASVHPGGGVHGMGGRNAAKRVLRDSRKPAGVVRTATGARRRPR